MGAFERALLVQPEVLRLGLVFLSVAVLCALLVRRERTDVSRLGLLYGFSLLLRVIAELLLGFHMPASGKTIGLLAVLLQGIAFIGIGGVFLFAVVLPLFRIEPPRILRDLTLGFGYLGLLFFVLSTYQVDVTGIVATSAVVTAVIGLALQDTLGNIMGGVALQLDGSVSVGDWVRIDDVEGLVREITWRNTTIETRDGDTALVPNSYLVKNRVTRLGRRLLDAELRQRRWIQVDVDLPHHPLAVLDSLKETIKAPMPNVAANPAPDAILLDLKERSGAALYAVRYWLTDMWADAATDSVMRKRIYYALKRAGFSVSIPTQHLLLPGEMRSGALREKEVTRERAREALTRTPFFRSLTPEQRDDLSKDLVLEIFAAGEVVVQQGSAVGALYILVSGSVEVRVSVEGGSSRRVTQMDAPETFGEMGLLTGETRRASVVARTEIECLRLDEAGFRRLVEARPTILTEISHLVAQRNVELDSFREHLTEEVRKRRVMDETGSILRKIQRFLGT